SFLLLALSFSTSRKGHFWGIKQPLLFRSQSNGAILTALIGDVNYPEEPDDSLFVVFYSHRSTV
ncbi:MAG: hypothetical protein NTX88_10960, partial [Candidatus Atribacteria bacterium]|nr:hypothetical protein [Candidatus Atribacteria bacterium]